MGSVRGNALRSLGCVALATAVGFIAVNGRASAATVGRHHAAAIGGSAVRPQSANGCTGVYPWDPYELCLTIIGSGTYVQYADVDLISRSTHFYEYLQLETENGYYNGPFHVLNPGQGEEYSVSFYNHVNPGVWCGAAIDATDGGVINRACDVVG